MFKISNTKNNTMEALKFLGILAPNMFMFLITIIRREYKKNEYLYKSDKVMILLSTILDIITIIWRKDSLRREGEVENGNYFYGLF